VSAKGAGELRTRPTIICLTPVRDEAWILERFLACASLWADHIIVADQSSTDGSREIAARFPKVTLVDNPPAANFDEYQMRAVLFEKAREIPGPRVLVVLDADEVLTADCQESPEWQMILDAPPGTTFQLSCLNLWPGGEQYWHGMVFKRIYADDGAPYTCDVIHTNHVPQAPAARLVTLREIQFLHFKYTDWARMESRSRWYQCWELANCPTRHPIDLFRFNYLQDYVAQSRQLRPVKPEWFARYEEQGIDMRSVRVAASYRWDAEVRGLLERYGSRYFSALDIWGREWTPDPRSRRQKLLHRYLRATQPLYVRWRPYQKLSFRKSPAWFAMRACDEMLKLLF
jgi:glycosyltransferase involved in cell wall biosynthesis